MNVAWTGHRPEYFAQPAAVAAQIEEIARQLRAEHAALRFHCGGQRGVDTWAAEAAVRQAIPLSLYLPLPIEAFAADWEAADADALRRTWAYATERIVVDLFGSRGAAAYQQRNALLAEHGDLLIALWTGLGGGGTAETIAAARTLGRPVREYRVAGSGRLPRPGERGV
jgi:hypothetical protein